MDAVHEFRLKTADWDSVKSYRTSARSAGIGRAFSRPGFNRDAGKFCLGMRCNGIRPHLDMDCVPLLELGKHDRRIPDQNPEKS